MRWPKSATHIACGFAVAAVLIGWPLELLGPHSRNEAKALASSPCSPAGMPGIAEVWSHDILIDKADLPSSSVISVRREVYTIESTVAGEREVDGPGILYVESGRLRIFPWSSTDGRVFEAGDGIDLKSEDSFTVEFVDEGDSATLLFVALFKDTSASSDALDASDRFWRSPLSSAQDITVGLQPRDEPTDDIVLDEPISTISPEPDDGIDIDRPGTSVSDHDVTPVLGVTSRGRASSKAPTVGNSIPEPIMRYPVDNRVFNPESSTRLCLIQAAVQPNVVLPITDDVRTIGFFVEEGALQVDEQGKEPWLAGELDWVNLGYGSVHTERSAEDGPTMILIVALLDQNSRLFALSPASSQD